MNRKRSSFVDATQEVAEFKSKLKKGSYLDKAITKAKKKMWENIFAGEPVEKMKIPECYIRKHRVNNLYVLNLDSSRRLVYTLLGRKEGVGVIVLDIFLTHKAYAKRFGYS